MIINCVHGGWHKVKDLLSEIESYWTTRAEGYSEVNHKELNGMQKGAWLEVLKGSSRRKRRMRLRFWISEQDLDFFLLFWLRRDIR